MDVATDEARIAELTEQLEQARIGQFTAIAERDAAAGRYQDQIATLNHNVNRYRDQRDEAQLRHREDIELLSDALLEEADSRGWCSDYDEFVETINRRLTVELTPRVKEHEVEFVLRFTVTVSARSQEAATELAYETARDIESFADRHEGTDHSSTLELSDY